MVKSIDSRISADLAVHQLEPPPPRPAPATLHQEAEAASQTRSAAPSGSEQGAQKRLADALEAQAQTAFEDTLRDESNTLASVAADDPLAAAAVEVRQILQSVSPQELRRALAEASDAAADEIARVVRSPLEQTREEIVSHDRRPSKDLVAAADEAPVSAEEQAARRGMAERFLAKYGEKLDAQHDPEQIGDVLRAFECAAGGARQVGDTDFVSTDKTLRAMLSYNATINVAVGGALMVGTGYSIGMWVMMRAVLPRLQHLPPALQGFIGGWIVSSIDKILSSGFAAVAAANQYGRGGLKHVPILDKSRPGMRRVAVTAVLIAGLGTFIKNLAGRGLSVQIAVPDRFVTGLTDLSADTSLSFASGAAGRFVTLRRLGGGKEAAMLLARDDCGEEIKRFKTPLSAAAFAEGAAQNALIFAKAAGRSVTLPSSWIAGLYCASLMAALMQSHDHINRKFGASGNIESRLEAFEHTLASSGLMALLVTGAVGIGIMGVCDGYRHRMLARIAASFSTPVSDSDVATAPAAEHDEEHDEEVEEADRRPTPSHTDA
ncbi:MAG: hypothetical protein GAK35_02598 [Herbaspirillum frisingense]|uniref:Uncharacterized protein n=1 Tax=Herbaspirillum frisingense TaxID=92645 RepID=A0A7V8FVU7_9BURK|nr:MAG: hypothetical protein GAK35_02598 [Herbaspirillum frisingense]